MLTGVPCLFRRTYQVRLNVRERQQEAPGIITRVGDLLRRTKSNALRVHLLLVSASSRLAEPKEDTCSNARPSDGDCDGVIRGYPLLARRPFLLNLVVDRIRLRE